MRRRPGESAEARVRETRRRSRDEEEGEKEGRRKKEVVSLAAAPVPDCQQDKEAQGARGTQWHVERESERERAREKGPVARKGER